MGNILKITNADQAFYKIMGPYLSRREIVKELGNHVWDDDGKVWYVYLQGEQVYGFVSALEKSGKIIFGSDYVLPEYRNSNVYSELFKSRQNDFAGAELIATVTEKSLNCYLENGFCVTGVRGKYSTVKRIPK